MTRSTEFVGDFESVEDRELALARGLQSLRTNAEIHGLLPELRELLSGMLKELGESDGQEN